MSFMYKKTYSLLIRSYYKLVAYEKIRFLVVGAAGFFVNYLILTVLFHLLKVSILPAQIVGAEAALLTTFVGNNFWAFANHGHISLRNKLIKYHLSAGTGLLINSCLVILLVHFSHMYYGLALVIGSAIALLWNYTVYKHFVFKTHKSTARGA